MSRPSGRHVPRVKRLIVIKTSPRCGATFTARTVRSAANMCSLRNKASRGVASDDNAAILALKMARRSPTISAHFAKIGLDPKLTHVGTVQAAFLELDAELQSWKLDCGTARFMA